MKKVILSLVAISSISAMQLVMAAAPHYELVRFECPHTSGGAVSERLNNSGASISGMGEENFGTTKTRPVFSGASNPSIPFDLSLGGYVSDGASYASEDGKVYCSYASTLGYSAFKVSYQMVNGKYGIVTRSTSSAVTLKLPQGIKS